MRWLGVAALGGVIAQGILGGLTVMMFQPPPVSAAHATLAQLFFSTLVALPYSPAPGGSVNSRSSKIPALRAFEHWCSGRWRRSSAVDFGRRVPPQRFRNYSAPDRRGRCYNLVFVTAGALKRRFAEVPALRSCALYLHILIGVQLLLGAEHTGRGSTVRRFPQPIAVMVTLTVPHGYRRAGAGRDAGTTLITYRMIRAESSVADAARAHEQVAS